MNKTALFFICLIAPIAFAQSDVLKMLDKTPEGKQVLNHLFIQTKLMGDNLDYETLQNFIRVNGAGDNTEDVNALNALLSACDADAEKFKSVIGEHAGRKHAVDTTLEVLKRRETRLDSQLERAQEELDNYTQFAQYVHNNGAAWAEFYSTAITNLKHAGEILNQILETAKSSAPAVGSAFVQIPHKVQTSLAQIKLKVQSSNVDFNGMGPVVSNLLEIMQSPSALSNPDVIVAVKGLVHNLIENGIEKIEQLEEENERQSALFSALEKTFNDNVVRSQKAVTALEAEKASLKVRITAVEGAVDHATALVGRVESIAQLRAEECNQYRVEEAEMTIRAEKIRAILEQIQEIILNHNQGVAAIQGFFIQRQMKKN